MVYSDAYSNKVHLIFEYMSGGDLRQCYRKNFKRGMPLDIVLSYTKKLLIGVKHIHDQGFIHRDLKSHNILLKKGQLKIADFGLSRFLTSPPKPMSKSVATLNWRAPEIILNNLKYTQAVDMWSIGIILYEMLTGQILFGG